MNPGYSKTYMARLAGLLYLLIIIFGLIAQVFVRDSLVVYADAAATAKNIRASESWYRFGFVSELLMLVCDLGVTTILLILLLDTSKLLSVLSTFFRLASIIILGITALTHYAALPLLTDSGFMRDYNPRQLEELALFSIKLHGVGYNISLLFFGFHLLVLGYLVYVSGLFKKFIGILLHLGGLSYIINSMVWFQFPGLVKYIYPAILIPCALGEWIFCIWLIVKGVKNSEQR